MMNVFKRIFYQPFLIRLFRWEFWSFGMVYTWIYPVWLFLALRARSLFFFSASNPEIENGGFMNESKKDIYAIMPGDLYPPTLYFNQGSSAEKVLAELNSEGFAYPLIGKPDKGGRGRGVKMLHTDEDVRNYIGSATMDFHIQKFIPLPREVGIFYYKFPGEKKGNISGIVRKEFLTVTGDGKLTVRELLGRSWRAGMYIHYIERMDTGSLDEIPAPGESRVIVPYGNHARGAKFIDDSAMADERLTAVVDEMCSQVKEFYFGRLDIRYNEWEELKDGKNFCIIEVNGAGSEPTHMYDPRHSLFFAWKEIIRHWIILWKISRMNHRRGHPYLTWKEARKMFREDRLQSEKLRMMPL